MQAGAATSAAQAQAQKAQQAMTIAGQNLQSALAPQYAAQGAISSLYGPYQAAGTQGVSALQQALQPGGTLAQPWTQQFQAPTAAQAAATPGYQFALQQGLNAIQSGAAAQGNLLTGGTQKNLANYATGLASQTYQQTYNNALNQYQTNYGTWANNQANLYNRLMGLTGVGTGTAANYGAQQVGLAGQIGGLYGQNTQTLANLLGAQGAAQAAGQVGAANAWAGGLGNIGSTAMNLAGTYAAMYQPQPLPPADITISGAPQYMPAASWATTPPALGPGPGGLGLTTAGGMPNYPNFLANPSAVSSQGLPALPGVWGYGNL
jgi:hypothetical protein